MLIDICFGIILVTITVAVVLAVVVGAVAITKETFIK